MHLLFRQQDRWNMQNVTKHTLSQNVTAPGQLALRNSDFAGKNVFYVSGFSVLFPQLQGKFQGKTRKDGAWPALFLIFVLFYVLFVLCRSVYCLCVYVYCTTATGWLPNCS